MKCNRLNTPPVQKARMVSKLIYKLTDDFLGKDAELLKMQMRKAIINASSNLTSGFHIENGSDRKFCFDRSALYYHELLACLTLCYDVDLIDVDTLYDFRSEVDYLLLTMKRTEQLATKKRSQTIAQIA